MAKAKKNSLAKKTLNPPKRDGELYVTKRLLDLTKKELKSDIAQLRMEMKAGFTKMNSKMDFQFSQVDSQFSKVNGEIASLRADMNASTARLESMFAKIVAISEEQNERNKVVLDSYGLVYDKLNNHDERLKKVEKHVLGIEQD